MPIFKALAASGIVLLASASQAQTGSNTDNARLLACYKEVKVPAKYDVTKVLIKAPERKYVRRNGLVLLLEYPAVYREDKKLIEAEHIVMQEVRCKS